VLLVAGCGGETKVATTTTPARTAGPSDVAECLNTVQFLVEVTGRTVTGNAPDGVAFVIRFYSSDAQAAAAAARLGARYSRAMGRTVIDYRGNPPAHPGGEPRVLIRDDFATLRHCIQPR